MGFLSSSLLMQGLCCIFADGACLSWWFCDRTSFGVFLGRSHENEGKQVGRQISKSSCETSKAFKHITEINSREEIIPHSTLLFH